MTIEPFRKTYNANIGELEEAFRDAHSKIGEYIASCRRFGRMPDNGIMLVYDNLLKLSNTVNNIKNFGPSITFSDEKGE